MLGFFADFSVFKQKAFGIFAFACRKSGQTCRQKKQNCSYFCLDWVRFMRLSICETADLLKPTGRLKCLESAYIIYNRHFFPYFLAHCHTRWKWYRRIFRRKISLSRLTSCRWQPKYTVAGIRFVSGFNYCCCCCCDIF